jgi:hypothetical protein
VTPVGNGTVTGWDATHAFIGHAPRTGQAAGYVTGGGGIAWTAADWAAHPGAVRIDQDPLARNPTADVLDVEGGAATAAECAGWHKSATADFTAGVRPGQRHPAFYCNLGTLPSVADNLVASGITGAGLWLAAGTFLTLAEAAALVTWGTALGGPFPVIGVQLLGAAADYDVDVFSQAWLAAVSGPVKPPPPPPGYQYAAPASLAAHGGHTSFSATWDKPAGAYPVPPAAYEVYVYAGGVADRATIVASYPRPASKVTAGGGEYSGGGLARGRPYTLHVVASGPGGAHEKPYTYASASFSTG